MHDPILLTKIARIYAERDAASVLALKGEVERNFKLVGEEAQVLAIAREFGREAVLAAWMDIQQVRIDTSKEVFSLRHLMGDSTSDCRIEDSDRVVLLKKVYRIFRETTDVVFVCPVDEKHPQIAALMGKFGRDAVLGTLYEVTKIWKEIFQEPGATEAQRVGMRLN